MAANARTSAGSSPASRHSRLARATYSATDHGYVWPIRKDGKDGYVRKAAPPELAPEVRHDEHRARLYCNGHEHPTLSARPA